MKDELIAALVKEIEMQKDYPGGAAIETIYFGGGTPSALPAEDIRRILDAIRQFHSVSQNAEVTLEANPDDITPENVSGWKASGINRLSIGIQAFQDELLHNWNRSHSAAQAIASVSLVREMGIENITADLIYGGPGLSDEDWVSNIQRLIDSGIPHISCYALTVETGTALFHQIQKGKAESPDDDLANRQYTLLQSMMASNGFEQYEVSNFAKPGFESRHNRSYWSGEQYLGIGPSAHSYNGLSRQWNVSNNIKYIHALAADEIPFEKEELTDVQRFNEIVMTGLRTSGGIDMERISALGEKFSTYLDQQIKVFQDRGQVLKNDMGYWALKPEYYFFADGMAAELFY